MLRAVSFVGQVSRMPRTPLAAARRVAFSAFVSTVLAATGCDPDRRDIEGGTCEDCSSELVTVWESDPQDPFVEDGEAFVRRGDKLWMFAGLLGHRIVVGDLAGDSSQLIDREGEGPGEFEDIDWAMDGANDSILVFDGLDGSVLDHEGRYGRSFSVPVPVIAASAFVATDGKDMFMYGRGEAGEGRIYRVSLEGEVRASFAAAGLSEPFQPIFKRTGEDVFWQLDGQIDGFEILKWKMDGTLLERLAVRPDWWWAPPRSRTEDPNAMTGDYLKPRSAPYLLFEAHGLIWVVARHHAPGWESVDIYQDTPPIDKVDSVIIGISPDTGEIVHTHVSEDFITGLVAEGPFLVGQRIVGAGFPQIVLFEFTFERGG